MMTQTADDGANHLNIQNGVRNDVLNWRLNMNRVKNDVDIDSGLIKSVKPISASKLALKFHKYRFIYCKFVTI